MSNCIPCGAGLEPPVRVPHTVYVKTLYHITTTAVAASIITEVKPGAGPVVAMPRGAQSTEYDRPHQ